MAGDFDEAATDLAFPEGPVAMADGSVLFVQIAGGVLSRFHPDTGVETVAELGGGPNGVAIGRDGAAYVCNNGGVYRFEKLAYPGYPEKILTPLPGGRPEGRAQGMIQRVDLATGAFETLYDAYPLEAEGKPVIADGKPVMKPLIAPDDIVVDRDGDLWFTDCGAVYPDQIALGGVFYAKPDGSEIRKVATVPTANGIGLSPDGGTIYVADTIFGRLWAIRITGPGETAPGLIPGTPGDVVQTLPGYQMLDSLKVLADGDVCVATLGIPKGALTTFSVKDRTTTQLRLDDPFVTNLCFCGDDMKDIWITAGGTGRLLKGRWDAAGLKLAY